MLASHHRKDAMLASHPRKGAMLASHNKSINPINQ